MLIIDRFEGQWAIIEYGDVTFNFPKDLLPKGIKEGNVLNINIEVNKKATEEHSKAMAKLVDDLFE